MKIFFCFFPKMNFGKETWDSCECVEDGFVPRVASSCMKIFNKVVKSLTKITNMNLELFF